MLTERLAEAKREALGAQLEAYGLASHLLPAARQEAALPASLDTQARGAHPLSTCLHLPASPHISPYLRRAARTCSRPAARRSGCTAART